MKGIPWAWIGRFAATLLLLLVPGSGSAQPDNCCRIRLDTILQFSTDADPIALTPSLSAVKLPDVYALAPYYQYPHVALYDHDGAFVGVYERSGQGPGEFGPSDLDLKPWGGDSLMVRQNQRIIVFDSDMEYGRTIVLPVLPWGILPLPAGNLVANAPFRGSDGARTLHVISSEGRLLESKGRPTSTFNSLDDVLRLIFAADGGGFWSAHWGSSRLLKHDQSGEEVAEVEVQRDWFREWGSPEDAQDPSLPRTINVVDLGSERLLVVSRLPASGPGRSTNQLADGRIAPDHDPSEDMDSIVELVHVRTGEVLSSLRHNHFLWPVFGTKGEFVVSEMGPSGFARITVVKVMVEGSLR